MTRETSGELKFPVQKSRRSVARGIAIAWLALFAGLGSGCLSFLTNTALLSDTSHLGTPYSGARADLHTLVCYGRSVARDASGLVFAPVMLLPLADLPLSLAVDTLLLPVDLPLEPERTPLRVGEGGCRLIGM